MAPNLQHSISEQTLGFIEAASLPVVAVTAWQIIIARSEFRHAFCDFLDGAGKVGAQSERQWFGQKLS
jgi:hypothetical protein